MEELYQALLQKFDANMGEDLRTKQISFLLTQDPTKAIDALYKKYTGALPPKNSKRFLYNKALELTPAKEEKIKPSLGRRFVNAFKKIGSSVSDDFLRDSAARRIEKNERQIRKIKNTPDSINSFRVGGVYLMKEGNFVGGRSVDRENALKYYEDLVEKDSKIFRENFIESKEMQEYLDRYEKINIFEDDGDNELWDDFNLTFDKTTGVVAEQIPQMLSALVSFGFTTYTQEGGAVATELINRIAAEEIGLTYEAFQNLPKDQQANAVLNAIQDGKTVDALNEANRVGIQNAAMDYASNLFLVGKATKFVPKTALRGILKGQVNQDAQDFLIGTGYSQLAEIVTENSQEINSALALDNPITAKLIAETTAQTILGTSGTQVSITGTSMAIREGIAELTALRDPESLRAIVNALKVEVKKSNKTQAEKDQILRNIDVAENVANNSTYRYLSYESRKKMFDLQIEKADAQSNLTGLEKEFKTNNSISIEAKIENEKQRIESYDNQLIDTKLLEYFHTTGKTLLSYINSDKTGVFAGKQGIMRKTRAELKAWLEKNRPDLLTDENVIDMLEGTVNESGMRMYTSGVMKGDLALFVEENVDNNIFKTNNGRSTSGNVVHHEVMHFIFESLSRDEKTSIIQALDTDFSNSTDPKMVAAYELLKQRLSVYGKFDLKNNDIVDEYLSGLSDVLANQAALENIEQANMFNKFGEAFAKTYSKNIKNLPFEISGENALELIKRYNSFTGVKPLSAKTVLEAADDVAKTVAKSGKVDIEEKTKPSKEAELTSEQIKASQNALDKYITEDIKTQDDFKASDVARAGIYTEIESNLIIDPVINSIIQRDENTGSLAPEVQEDIKRKVRERITERIFKNFNPTLEGNKRSVFSYIYGKKESKGLGGIAFRAFQDVKLEYVKKPKAQSIETDAGATIDILDETSMDVESMIDAKILSENIENTSNPKMEDEIDILTEDDIKDLQDFVDEIFGEDQAFDPSDADFRNNIKNLFENAVMPKIRKAAGNFEKFFDKYIDKLFDPKKKLLSIQYLYQAERKLENKNFAKLNKRLTTQEEIRKARDEKNAFVENEAQGVDLYDRLKPSLEILKEYYSYGEKKPNSTIRARRNKLFAEFGKEIAFNLSPAAIKQSPLSTEDQATAARKIERTLASRQFAFKMGLGNIWYNVTDDTKRYSNGMIDFLPYLDKFPGLLNIGIVTSGLQMGGYITKDQIQEIKQQLLAGSKNWVGKKNFSYGKSATRKQVREDAEKNYYKGAPINQKNLKTRSLQWLEETTDRYTNAGIHLWLAINEFINEPNITQAQKNERLLTMIHFMVNSYKDKSHLHRRMAKLAGFDVVAAANNEQMIMEHAMQSFRAWKELLSGINKKEIPFTKLLDKVLENYVLIGMSKKDADKVDAATYIDNEGKTKFYKFGMGRNWNLWKDSWTRRHFNSAVAKIDGGVTIKNYKTLQGKSFSVQFNIKKDGTPRTLPSKEANLDLEFNSILEDKSGVLSTTKYSAVRARRRGKNKGRYNLFIPPGAEDFLGLMYTLLPKGFKGDQAIEWVRINLIRPFGRAMANIERERSAMMADFAELKLRLPKLPKKAGIFAQSPLQEKVLDGDFTMGDAVRVYIWNKQKMQIPGLSKEEEASLVNLIKKDKTFKDFADNLILITKADGYIKPDNNWESGTISTDLKQSINTTKREKYLQQWQKNADTVFSEENLNKLEALFGRKYREALEDILRRMKTGRNRKPSNNKQINIMLDWLNDAVGTIMFLNRKSAVLQTISTINFINWSDNNLLQAGKAFSNQKQFWGDFMRLFNSDYLVQRRGGLKININESELVEQAEKGGMRGVISLLLSKGFVLTRYADSFAIALGGASFIRNRTNTYTNKGLEQDIAFKRAFEDFREIAEETQQSSRPDKISMQQASNLGRVVLAFANTPMQYARLMKRAAQDIRDGRGDPRTNWSKLIYYSFVQNFIFNAMQQALFAMGFGEEEEDEKERDRVIKTAEGMADSVIRGTGVYGNIILMAKNVAVDLARRAGRPRPKFGDAAWKLFDFMPPVDRKVTQIRQALSVFDYEMDEIKESGLSLDNPATMAAARFISATANIPLDQAMRLYEQGKGIVDSETELWQKLALLLGWDGWTLKIEEDNTKLIKKKNELQPTKIKKLKIKKLKIK